MRILHITATHLGFAGGVPLMLKELITEQNELADCEARLLSINADVKDIDCPYFDYLADQNVEDFICSYRPDIVIMHSFFHVEYAMMYRILKKYRIPYCIEPHGSFVKNAFHKSWLKKNIANRTIFSGLIKNARAYIYLCDGERDSSVYHKPDDIIIPNGIRHIELLKHHNNIPKLYYIGRFDIHEKGIDVLFDALEMLDQDGEKFVFDFFGIGSDNEINYINERANKLKSIIVKNQGPIYGIEKHNTISTYDIMVLLSRHEGFPMSVLEAWNYGIPCIISPNTNMAMMVEKNGLGWVCDLNTDNIYNTIKNGISEYTKLSYKFQTDCNNYVLNNHQWSQIAEVSYEMLLPLLNN